MVESQPSKLLVAGSIPVSRSIFSPRQRNLLAIDTSRWRRGPQVAYRLRARSQSRALYARDRETPSHKGSLCARNVIALRDVSCSQETAR
jgi:hypothetical protein